eukprot:9845623-Ditylum_brightwellii.AAC.1
MDASGTDTDLITMNDNDHDENTANDNHDENAESQDRAHEPLNNDGSDTSSDNGVDGSGAYQQFKELLCCDSLHDINACSLKLMEPPSLEKLDKGATTSATKLCQGMKGGLIRYREGSKDVNNGLYIQHDSLI